MKKWIIVPFILVLAVSALGIYLIIFTQVGFQVNTYVTFQVDENGNADAQWVYEIPPSALADQVRLSVVGGTMEDVPVHGMGVENAKLIFLADVRSSYAKYGLEMENINCDIVGLNHGETFKITIQWKSPYFAYRRENRWEILFSPIDNESYAQETINQTKSLQSTLSVITAGSRLNVTSKTSIVMPAGASVSNQSEISGLGTQSLDYGGGTSETVTIYIQDAEGKQAVVAESHALITPQLITITENELLEATQFLQIDYTGIPVMYDFDGSASWAAVDMKFGRVRDEYTVTMDGQEHDLTPYQLLYYSAKRVVNLAEDNFEPLLSDAQPISVLPPDNENGDWDTIFKTLTKDEYVALARWIRGQIDSTGTVLGSINTSIGALRSKDAMFTFLRVISFYHKHGYLPDNMVFTPYPAGNLLSDGAEIPASHAYYLLSTQYAITDTTRATQIVSDFRALGYDDPQLAESLNQWVYENITYQLVLGFFTSEEVLDTKEGKCLDKAHLYLALMRTAGIPSKRVDGFLIYEQLTYPFYQIAGVTPDGRYIIGHSWTEVYLPSEGWVFADPTADQFRISTYSGNLYSSLEQTWQEVLASYETTYGPL